MAWLSLDQASLRGAPRDGTSFSLANQSRAARTVPLWLARVFALTPICTWCKREIGIRTAVQRAGISGDGLPSALVTTRNEHNQCRRLSFGRSSATSIVAIASAIEGSMRGSATEVLSIGRLALCTEVDQEAYRFT
jgi:hypothetical protein